MPLLPQDPCPKHAVSCACGSSAGVKSSAGSACLRCEHRQEVVSASREALGHPSTLLPKSPSHLPFFPKVTMTTKRKRQQLQRVRTETCPKQLEHLCFYFKEKKEKNQINQEANKPKRQQQKQNDSGNNINKNSHVGF